MHAEHNDTMKTSDTVLSKNIPLTLFERVVCERELETEQNCNILTPTLLAITAFLSRSPGLLNRGPLWDMFLNPAFFSNSSDPQLLNRGSRGPLLLGAVFSTPSFLKLIWSPNWLNFLCTELYNSSTSTFFLWTSKSHSFNPSTVKVIFWYSLSGFTCYLHRCISYIYSPAGP